MKKFFLLLALAGASLSGSAQQRAPYAKAYLEANNIRSSVMTYGNMWYDPVTGNAECEYPKGSGKHAGYASGLWLGGYDAQGNLKTAAALYNSQGRQDYFPGILEATGTSDTAIARLWRRVWNIRRTTIDSFRAIFRQVGPANPSALNAALSAANFDDLKAWPAKGSTTIKGFNNQAISLAATPNRDYAPFVDVDGDGKYNYLAGDYPKIKGDQMLWMAFNDAAGPKTQTGTYPIGLEIHLSAYAYARGTLADNIQFYEYKIHNYGFGSMDSTHIGIWSDIDLGYAYDDYIGFDSSHRLGYAYNGKATDSVYGANPPISGVVLLRTVGDNATRRVPTGAFSYFSNPIPGIPPAANLTDPSTAQGVYNYLEGRDTLGRPFINPKTGLPTHTVLTGNPSDTSQWSACAVGELPGDRRFVLSSAPFRMAAGSVQEVAFALVISPNAGGCPAVDMSGIRATADTAFYLYDNPVYATAVENVASLSPITLFPNPVNAELKVQNLPANAVSVRVLDVMGRTISLPVQQRSGELVLQTAALTPGIYMLQITGGEATETRRFVKQ